MPQRLRIAEPEEEAPGRSKRCRGKAWVDTRRRGDDSRAASVARRPACTSYVTART